MTTIERICQAARLLATDEAAAKWLMEQDRQTMGRAGFTYAEALRLVRAARQRATR